MSKNSETNKMVSGGLFLYAIDFFKNKKNGSIEELEKSFGTLLFDSHKMYPLEQLIDLHQKILSMSFGNTSDEGYYALGQYTFDSFVHSIVGATLTNVTPTPKILLGKIQEIWGAVVNFGTRKLSEIDENKGRAIIEIKDDPRNPAYLQGIIESGLSLLKLKDVKTEIIGRKDGEYKVEISWIPLN
jgi:uncharacterized protein (TIGR02265 family)